jgi:hypothetical protein
MLRYLLPAEMKSWNRESHPCAASVNSIRPELTLIIGAATEIRWRRFKSLGFRNRGIFTRRRE